jgi:hypothetical protein
VQKIKKHPPSAYEITTSPSIIKVLWRIDDLSFPKPHLLSFSKSNGYPINHAGIDRTAHIRSEYLAATAQASPFPYEFFPKHTASTCLSYLHFIDKCLK